MEQDKNEKLCITVSQLAKKLSVGTTTAYKLVKEKNFPARRLYGKWIIPVEALNKWLREE